MKYFFLNEKQAVVSDLYFLLILLWAIVGLYVVPAEISIYGAVLEWTLAFQC
jgi:hypothetical protein